MEPEQTHGPDEHFKHLKCLDQRMYLKNNRQTLQNLLGAFFIYLIFFFFDEFSLNTRSPQMLKVLF